MQLVPAVTELVISELLWLNFSSPEKPVYVYLHSIGSQTPDGQAVGFDTEAYAILDTLAYIRPEIHTLALGQVSPAPAICSAVFSFARACTVFAFPFAILLHGRSRPGVTLLLSTPVRV